jgi:hypothetical protein
MADGDHDSRQQELERQPCSTDGLKRRIDVVCRSDESQREGYKPSPQNGGGLHRYKHQVLT